MDSYRSGETQRTVGGEDEKGEGGGKEEFHTDGEGSGAKKHKKGILVSEVSRSAPIQFLLSFK